VAGVDPVAGGTWFGVNERGLLVAVTNRPKTELPPEPRSRGLLVRELLGLGSVAAARDQAVRELDSGKYAGCNLLCADATSAMVIQAGDWLRVRLLPPGIHCLTAHDVNDSGDSRLGYALWYLSQRQYACADECVRALRELCPQTGNGAPPICLHGERGGTVSSSIVVMRSSRLQSVYWHAQGPPDRTPYTDVSALLREIARDP
jgi:hypothetical protein